VGRGGPVNRDGEKKWDVVEDSNVRAQGNKVARAELGWTSRDGGRRTGMATPWPGAPRPVPGDLAPTLSHADQHAGAKDGAPAPATSAHRVFGGKGDPAGQQDERGCPQGSAATKPVPPESSPESVNGQHTVHLTRSPCPPTGRGSAGTRAGRGHAAAFPSPLQPPIRCSLGGETRPAPPFSTQRRKDAGAQGGVGLNVPGRRGGKHRTCPGMHAWRPFSPLSPFRPPLERPAAIGGGLPGTRRVRSFVDEMDGMDGVDKSPAAGDGWGGNATAPGAT